MLRRLRGSMPELTHLMPSGAEAGGAANPNGLILSQASRVIGGVTVGATVVLPEQYILSKRNNMRLNPSYRGLDLRACITDIENDDKSISTIWTAGFEDHGNIYESANHRPIKLGVDYRPPETGDQYLLTGKYHWLEFSKTGQKPGRHHYENYLLYGECPADDANIDKAAIPAISYVSRLALTAALEPFGQYDAANDLFISQAKYTNPATHKAQLVVLA